MSKSIILFLGLIIICGCSCAQNVSNPEITVNELSQHVSFLASDSCQGRKPGTIGGNLAANYIRYQFNASQLKSLGDNFFQSFVIVSDVDTGKGNCLKFNDFTAVSGKDFIPYSFSGNATLNASIVFTGYGFDISSDTFKWNDYKNVDVAGKWVMALRGDPELDNLASVFIPFSNDRGKALTAKDKGAAGILLVSGHQMEKRDKLVSLYYDKSSSNAGIPVININRKIANQILSNSQNTVEDLEMVINESMKPKSFDIPVDLYAKTNIIQTKVKTENIVGIIEGNDKVLKNEYIVIGAHYDHLGLGGPGSGSRVEDTVAVHYGADDNASGVAGVIELAEKLSFNRENLKRSLIFIAFTAEEMGLIGSKYFVKDSIIDLEQIKCMVNFDMIGRLKADTKKLTIGGIGTALEFDSIIKKYSENRIFNLGLSPDGYGPSDHSSFYSNKIPVLFFTTGAHEDYHKPADNILKIDFISEKEILDFVYDIVFCLANLDNELTFKETGSKPQSRSRKYKVTLGIIPDVTSKGGLGVDGLRSSGPAEKAGMLKGDLIVAINGLSVGNIYEYMARLAKLEPGQIVTVEVVRNGEKKVLLVEL